MEWKANHVSSRTVLHLRDVLEITGLSRATLYIKIKKKEFPHQVSLGTHAVGWIEHEVQDWIDWRANLRVGTEPEIHPAWESVPAREVTKNRSEREVLQKR